LRSKPTTQRGLRAISSSASRAATALDCSLGIGQNKLQAKLATGFGKPAGIFRLTHESWFALLGEQPTDVLWGIGAKTAKRLGGMGISTVLELSRADSLALAAALGPTTGPWLVQLAQSRDSSPVVGTPYMARSHSRETTFQEDLEDWTAYATKSPSSPGELLMMSPIGKVGPSASL